MSTLLDRRPRHRGDERRAALLAALDALLETGEGLDAISVADISGRAGVTRSAFYFYFESKAAAVAASGEQMFREVLDAAELLVGDGDPVARVRGCVSALYETWRRHEHLFRALLEARAASPAVREMWRADSALFVEPVAAMVEAERAAGRAPAGADARALATVLLDVNERMLERLALGTDLDHEALQAAVVDVWLRTVYGRPLEDAR